jgi:hypothetical protein
MSNSAWLVVTGLDKIHRNGEGRPLLIFVITGLRRFSKGTVEDGVGGMDARHLRFGCLAEHGERRECSRRMLLSQCPNCQQLFGLAARDCRTGLLPKAFRNPLLQYTGRLPLRLPAYSSAGPARSLNTRHRGLLRVWRWRKPKAARELCRATLGRTAGVLRFHSSLEGLTDKGVLCSGNYSEQFYTDAIQPSDPA